MIKCIRLGKKDRAFILGQQSTNKTYWIVVYNNIFYLVVYGKILNCIHTFLPLTTALDNNFDVQKKHEDHIDLIRQYLKNKE